MLGTAPGSTARGDVRAARLRPKEAIAGYKAQQDRCAKANHSTPRILSFGTYGCVRRGCGRCRATTAAALAFGSTRRRHGGRCVVAAPARIAGNAALRDRWPSLPIIIGRHDAAKLTNPAGNLSAAFGMNLISPPADRLLATVRPTLAGAIAALVGAEAATARVLASLP
jgi:hypothetical protein